MSNICEYVIVFVQNKFDYLSQNEFAMYVGRNQTIIIDESMTMKLQFLTIEVNLTASTIIAIFLSTFIC